MKQLLDTIKRYVLSKFTDQETAEETRARVRKTIAKINYANIYLNVFYEGEWGSYRNKERR